MMWFDVREYSLFVNLTNEYFDDGNIYGNCTVEKVNVLGYVVEGLIFLYLKIAFPYWLNLNDHKHDLFVNYIAPRYAMRELYAYASDLDNRNIKCAVFINNWKGRIYLCFKNKNSLLLTKLISGCDFVDCYK